MGPTSIVRAGVVAGVIVASVTFLGGCAVLLMGPSPLDKHSMEAECRSRGASPLCWRQAFWKRKDVRPGIEAATQHLRAHDFTDLKDLPEPERCPIRADCSPTQWFRGRDERDRDRAFEERVQFTSSSAGHSGAAQS